MAVYSQPIDPTVYPDYHNYLVKLSNGQVPQLYPKDLIYINSAGFNQFPLFGSIFLYTFNVTNNNGTYIISNPSNTTSHETCIDDFNIIGLRYSQVLDEKYNGDNTNITENYSENLGGYQKILYFLDANDNLLSTIPISSVSHSISFNSYNNSSSIGIGYNIDTQYPFVLLFGYYFDGSGNETTNFKLIVDGNSDMYFSNITNTAKIVMYGTKERIPYEQPNYVD